MPKSKYKRRSDGRFETKITIGVDDTGKRIRKSITAHSSAELEEKVAEAKKMLLNGTLTFNSSTLISDYCESWYKTYKSKKETNTKAMYKNIIDSHICACLGSLQIKQLKKQNIQAMINDRFDKPRTCQQILLVLRQIINEMKSDRLISPLDAENLLKNISMPKYKAKEKRALNKREIEAVKKADFSSRERAFVYAIFYFGLRREEALGLMQKDFDFLNNKLHIERAVIFDKNNSEQKGTKSFAGKRTIDIPEESIGFFKEYISGLGGLYLFTKLDGTPITKSSYTKMWESILKKMNNAVITESERKLGITPIKITAHYFRHNYCTLLYYSGLSLGKAVELMGHSDYRMIMNIYKHLDDEKEQTLEKINKNIKLAL